MRTTVTRALAALGLLLAALAAPTPAAACEPIQPDPWFLGDPSADASGLPPGIALAIPDPAAPSTLIITNTTGAPLIVLAALPEPGLPEPAPVARLAVGDWQRWDESRWRPGLDINSRAQIAWPHYPDPAAVPDPYAARPANPVAPAPARAAFAWRHADQTILVPLTITYRLNPHYDAARSEAALKNLASFDPCGRFGGPLLLWIAVPALLIAGGVASYFWQNRSARS